MHNGGGNVLDSVLPIHRRLRHRFGLPLAPQELTRVGRACYPSRWPGDRFSPLPPACPGGFSTSQPRCPNCRCNSQQRASSFETARCTPCWRRTNYTPSPSHSLTTTALPLRARHATLRDLAILSRRRTSLPAGVHGGGFLLGLDVLPGRCGTTRALSSRWPPSRLWQPLYDGIRAWLLVPRYRSSRCWGRLGWYGLSSRCWLWRSWRGCDGTRHYASCLMSAGAKG